jgi:hypothetical protein
MALPDTHESVEVESFRDVDKAGIEGKVQLRPVKGQKFPTTLLLEGNKSLIADYPVGTRFKVQVVLTQRPTGGQFLFSSWQWDTKVLSQPEETA